MTTKISEHKIIEGLKNDDTASFNYLFKEFFQALCYFAVSLIGNNQEAEDIVLSTYQKFYNLRHNFETLINIKAFMYITTRNACFDYLRQRQRENEYRKEYNYLAELADERTIENIRIEAEILRLITEEVDKLPDKYKKVFQLSFFQGLKTEEIASILNVSSVYVRNIKSRAIKMLRVRLFDKGLLSLLIALFQLNRFY